MSCLPDHTPQGFHNPGYALGQGNSSSGYHYAEAHPADPAYSYAIAAGAPGYSYANGGGYAQPGDAFEDAGYAEPPGFGLPTDEGYMDVGVEPEPGHAGSFAIDNRGGGSGYA